MSAAFNPAEFQRNIKVHATLMSIGFLILLPLGILIPRYARTFTNKWFYGHAGFQLFLAGPIIIAGFGMGVHTTDLANKQGGYPGHLADPHKKTGVALFILYMLQVLIGLTAHWFKRPSLRFLFYRSPQQWLHISLGLAIMSLAFYQVHLGYTFEYPQLVVVPPVPPSVDKAWMAWVIIIPVLYVLGFAFIPRQISQESAGRHEKNGRARREESP